MVEDVDASRPASGSDRPSVGKLIRRRMAGQAASLQWGVRFTEADRSDGRAFDVTLHPTQLYDRRHALIFGMLWVTGGRSCTAK